MEENIKLEQPISNVQNSQTEDSEFVDMGQSEGTFDIGSNSKFKSVEALNSAYNSLQAEFTKKCQHLRELEKSMENNEVPRYKLDSWNAELNDFFEKNPKAKDYSKEIAKEILENDSMAKKSDCLTLAWAKILNEKYVSNSDLAQDKEFLEKYIFGNENIRDEIIKNYLKGKEKVPTVITGSKGAFNIAPKSKPHTMEDAKSLVNEIFK